MEKNCLFCRIISGEIPASKVYEDEICLAFKDINPQAPIHILLVPKEHVASLADTDDSHEIVLGKLLSRARKLAAELGVDKAGYRVVINTNENGGQTVFHLHLHLLAGRPFIFPPG
jgi:histidine triad (HIT) family protein